MKKINLRAVAASAAFAIAAFAPFGQAQALTLLGQAVNPSLIVSAGGMEWVYAAPCAGLSPSCGTITLSNGFNFATDAQWTASFASITQLNSAFTGKCAAAYFSNFHDHCDFVNVNDGYIWHSPLAPDAAHSNSVFAETFLVRADVPEPASLALLGLGLIGVAAARRKSRA